MKQGQHVRLRATYKPTGSNSNVIKFVANSLDLSFHISNTLEDSTTKDTTDSSGLWLEYEKTKYNADGSVTAIVTLPSDQDGDTEGMTLNDIKDVFMKEAFEWQLLHVDGANNRHPNGGTTPNVGVICYGSKMTFSSVEVSSPKDGYAQVTANFQIFSGITVPST